MKAQLGYDAIPINDICEYELVKSGNAQPRPVEFTPAEAPKAEEAPENEAAASEEAPAEAPAEKQTASLEEVQAIREKMSKLHADFEQLLYNATLAVDGAHITAKKADELNTLLLNLEKGIVKLGSEAIVNEK